MKRQETGKGGRDREKETERQNKKERKTREDRRESQNQLHANKINRIDVQNKMQE